MTQEKKQIIASIPFQTHKPTLVTSDALFDWVVWQFPHSKQDGFCGAVHPPLPNHSWYPAIIEESGEKIHVFAHLETHFSSPEEALNYLL